MSQNKSVYAVVLRETCEVYLVDVAPRDGVKHGDTIDLAELVHTERGTLLHTTSWVKQLTRPNERAMVDTKDLTDYMNDVDGYTSITDKYIKELEEQHDRLAREVVELHDELLRYRPDEMETHEPDEEDEA
jgi:hypothetical protein